MKLKEIKPGMVIHCKTREELEQFPLLDWLKHHPYEYTKAPCYLYIGSYSFMPYVRDWGKEVPIGTLEDGMLVNFSDLIIPEEEMSTEEVLQICNEICGNTICDNCVIGEPNCFACKGRDYSKTVEICRQWKSDHEKKEPEVEWVYRVFALDGHTEDKVTVEDANRRCEQIAKEGGSAYYHSVCRVKGGANER